MRRFTLIAALLCGALAAIAAPSIGHSPFAVAQEHAAPTAALDLQDGDTVVFLGDSITHQCLYTQYIEDYYYTRYPTRKIRFHNSGVGGDKAADALLRFDDDVASYKPKYVTVLLGMNDGRYTRFEQEIFDTYETGMTELVERIHALGAKAVLMTPTMFDSRASRIRRPKSAGDLRNSYYNGVLAFYGAWLREQATDRGLGFVDMYSPLNNITFAERKTDANFTIIADAVHPGAAGQVVMAMAVLQDMSAKRSVTSLTAIRAAQGWRVNAQGGKIVDKSKGDELDFTFAAQSLPWVLPEEADLGYKLSKAGHRMSNERFRVVGLKPGKYKLTIDGQAVGVYTHSQLAAKIELQANAKTPQHQQALQVAQLNKERNDKAVRPLRNAWLQRKRRRATEQKIKADPNNEALADERAAWNKWYAEFKEKTAAAEKLAQEYEAKIYAAAQPQPRRYVLKRAS